MKGSRRERILASMTAIKEYEQGLSPHLISCLQQVPGLKIWGITDPARLAQRVPTVSFTLQGHTPRQVAEYLSERGIFVWDGNYYALAVMERLRLEPNGGMVRVGLAHYNTTEEVDRLLGELRKLRQSS